MSSYLSHRKTIYEDHKKHIFITEQQIEKDQKYALGLQEAFDALFEFIIVTC